MSNTLDPIGMANQESQWHAPPEQKKQSASDKKKAVSASNQKTMPQEITQALSPQLNELNALPGEYKAAMAGFDSTIASEPKTGNANLDKAIATANQSVMAGEPGVEHALEGLGKAGKTLAQDLPVSDVLATSLTEKKNALQYGTIPTMGIDTSHWSAPLQEVYKYINGKVAATPGIPGASTPGSPGLPSIKNAAAGNYGNTIPSGTGAALGQGG